MAQKLALRSVLPLVFFFVLFVFEEYISVPSCRLVPGAAEHEEAAAAGEDDELKVILASDLMLLGSDAGVLDLYFRDYYMSKFFKKSFHSVKPDLLLILGDVSAKGSELTRNKWLSVLTQFHWILGPFLDVPFHVTLGDRDIGECSELDAKSLIWVSNRFPELDSSGCGAFEINNVTFISLNSMALLCGNNVLRFGVEKAIERESLDARTQTEDTTKETDMSSNSSEISDRNAFGWRENSMSSGSGPVVLVHYPLHGATKERCIEEKAFKKAHSFKSYGSKTTQNSELVYTELCELEHAVPPNATEYIFQALRPRIIFSAHTHEFRDHTHSDGTREVSIPSMAWKARDDPGFVLVTFRTNTRAVSVAYCSLPRESHVLTAYTSFLLLLITTTILANKFRPRCSRQCS